jgi:hypothetical protein
MGSWEEHVRRVLLEEEEDDDELFFVILPAIFPYLSEEKRPTTHPPSPVLKRLKKFLKGMRAGANLSSEWRRKYSKPHQIFLEERIYYVTREKLALRSSLGCSCI